MPLGSLLLFFIGKSGAILTIYMTLHLAVKTAGKSTENRPPISLPSTRPMQDLESLPDPQSPLSPERPRSACLGSLWEPYDRSTGGNLRILVK